MSEHSKLPIYYDHEVGIYRDNKGVGLDLFSDVGPENVVKAVNNHEALKAALETLINEYVDMCYCNRDVTMEESNGRPEVIAARVALSAAK